MATMFPLAGLAILPLHSFVGTEPSLVARLVVTGMLALAAARPDHALLVCAGLAPLAGPLGALLGSSVSLAEELVLAFLGGWLLHEGVRPQRADPATQAVVTPAILFGGAVAASCAAQLIVLQTSADYAWPFLRHVAEFLWRDYFFDRGRFQSITASMLLLEGVGLYVSLVTLCRRDASLGQRVARMVAACGAGVAALNINRLLTVSLRSGISLKELAAGPHSIRISSAFLDVNAAGSYFAMVLLLAGGLFFAYRRLRLAWSVAAVLMVGALWLTGSRAALMAVPVSAVFMFAIARSARGRSLVRPVVLGVVALVLVAVTTARFSEITRWSLSQSMNVRMELARVGLKMFAWHPLFGVGVGRYYLVSGDFSTPKLPSIYRRENAHNNFLQILAELGIVGFTLFLWILVAVARCIRSVQAASRASPMFVGATGGLLAFLLTCLAGHPLLIREVAYAFWLVLGLTVVLAQGPSAVADDQRVKGRWFSRRRLACAVTLLLLVSVPIQGRLMLAEADLEHAAIGFSGWQTDSEGVRFRWMAGHAQFYVSSDARAVKLPLRLEAVGNTDSWPVEIFLEGRLATRILVESRAWREVRFIMPQAQPQPRFWRIELRVPPMPTEAGTADRRPMTAPPRIQVGGPELTRPPS